MADNNIFLDLGPIKGNAKHKKFIDKIALDSYSHDVSRALTSTTANAQRTVGNPYYSDITCYKSTDLSTTELFQYCQNATVIPKVTLTVGTNVGATGDWVSTIVYVLEDVIIASVSTSGSDGVPSDSFVLNFSKITGTYTKQDDTGASKGNADFIYDKSSL
jgi:type VI secretion system secreted protein Hcp